MVQQDRITAGQSTQYWGLCILTTCLHFRKHGKLAVLFHAGDVQSIPCILQSRNSGKQPVPYEVSATHGLPIIASAHAFRSHRAGPGMPAGSSNGPLASCLYRLQSRCSPNKLRYTVTGIGVICFKRSSRKTVLFECHPAIFVLDLIMQMINNF